MNASTVESLNTKLNHCYLPMYTRVTEHLTDTGMLRENNRGEDICQFDERFLQALWNEQFFCDCPQTVAGDAIEVISPGTWNLEGGPDFRNAVLRIGGVEHHGDVEIHRIISDWRQHGHVGDPAYANVILHAVWSRGRQDEALYKDLPPCFEMRAFMDRPWYAATKAIDLESGYPYARQVGPGACVPRWAGLEDAELRRFLRIAGLARLREKAGRFQRSAIVRGSEQTLYEFIFEALGYKANKHNFRCLAQETPLAQLMAMPDPAARQAALFGAAQFLPDTSTVDLPLEVRDAVRRLWDYWWQLGRKPAQVSWQLGSCRPLNTPFRRLAAGVEILKRWHWQPALALKEFILRTEDPRVLIRRLRDELSFHSEWDRYTTLCHTLTRPARLLGESRQRDILVNVLLPAAWFLAQRDGLTAQMAAIEQAYLDMPMLQSNRMLKEAAHRLLAPPSRVKAVARQACEQQGMLALYNDFCLRLDGDCTSCPMLNSELFEIMVQQG